MTTTSIRCLSHKVGRNCKVHKNTVFTSKSRDKTDFFFFLCIERRKKNAKGSFNMTFYKHESKHHLQSVKGNTATVNFNRSLSVIAPGIHLDCRIITMLALTIRQQRVSTLHRHTFNPIRDVCLQVSPSMERFKGLRLHFIVTLQWFHVDTGGYLISWCHSNTSAMLLYGLKMTSHQSTAFKGALCRTFCSEEQTEP